MNPLLDSKSIPGFHSIGRNPNDLSIEDLAEGGFAPRTPSKAIRHFCFECMGECWKTVATCGSVSCPLWPFRMGSRPMAWRGLRSLNVGADPHTPHRSKDILADTSGHKIIEVGGDELYE